ncbi:MAG: hypothetical protein KF845_13405 [Cyclobacteriaceae bacterium]|nr:hypothetical protein [Cyclobacteriaceae bacterium]
MKGIKLILLLLALALPVLIFVFLKFFGKNEFTVEPLFAEGAPVVAGCPEFPQGQYYIPAEILNRFGWSLADSLTVIFTADTKTERLTFSDRLHEEFSEHEVRILKPEGIPADSLQQLRTCYFFLNKPYDLLLVDNQQRIRGQYHAASREEVDRLLVEAKIILKKY